jgi:hypothetical protein
VFYVLLHIAYYQCQAVSPGNPPSSLAKAYHQNTLEEIKQRTQKNKTILQNIRKKSRKSRVQLFYRSGGAEDQVQLEPGVDGGPCRRGGGEFVTNIIELLVISSNVSSWCRTASPARTLNCPDAITAGNASNAC